MSRKRKKKKGVKRRGLSYSTINQHHRVGKTLIPPMLKVPKLQRMSWANERLPEMLWAALLVSQLPRSEAIAVFREVAKYVGRFSGENTPYDITHTGLSKLESQTVEEIVEIMVATDESKEALRPLTLLRDLPFREGWVRALGPVSSVHGWEALRVAVAKTLFHQTQEATDCRWARVICFLTAGKLKLPSEEITKEFFYYPGYGDMRKVRPSVRAMEGTLNFTTEPNKDWPEKFWNQCLSDTTCFSLQTLTGSTSMIVGSTPGRLTQVYELLVAHCNHTRSTTATDPRHDGVFGLAFYCLSILQELFRIGASQSVTARISLRTIVECFVTLAYLARKDSPELWNSFRVFGAGQAKLAYLKLEELVESPTHVDAQSLKNLANEDMWEEFLPIELGHWEKANLRQLSIGGGTKDDYDRFYSWTSVFAHGHWGAVRDAIYDTCGNSLHRLHRIPRKSARTLPDVLPDACTVTDKVLEIVSQCYPQFPHRVTVAK